MRLKVLKIKGLGKIFVIYASFCAPYLNRKQLTDVSPSIVYHSQIYELFVITASIY